MVGRLVRCCESEEIQLTDEIDDLLQRLCEDQLQDEHDIVVRSSRDLVRRKGLMGKTSTIPGMSATTNLSSAPASVPPPHTSDPEHLTPSGHQLASVSNLGAVQSDVMMEDGPARPGQQTDSLQLDEDGEEMWNLFSFDEDGEFFQVFS